MTETTALALPSEEKLKAVLDDIRRFQRQMHMELVEGQDYGVIPGTGSKPTLYLPGAQKVTKALLLREHYEEMEIVSDWDRSLFAYSYRCLLTDIATGVVVAEGVGECNSYESKYRYRWVFERELPLGMDASTLTTRSTRNGGIMYRLQNDDMASQRNTIMKMAAKRSLVAAALSAGRLSEIFTQDMEDWPRQETVPVEGEVVSSGPAEAPAPAQAQVPAQAGTALSPAKCPVHNVAWKKNRSDGGEYHILGKDENGQSIFCNPRDAYRPARDAALTRAGWSVQEMEGWTMEKYGSDWYPLSAAQCCEVIAFLDGEAAKPQAPAPQGPAVEADPSTGEIVEPWDAFGAAEQAQKQPVGYAGEGQMPTREELFGKPPAWATEAVAELVNAPHGLCPVHNLPWGKSVNGRFECNPPGQTMPCTPQVVVASWAAFHGVEMAAVEEYANRALGKALITLLPADLNIIGNWMMEETHHGPHPAETAVREEEVANA